MLLLDVRKKRGITEITLSAGADIVTVIEVVAGLALPFLRVLAGHVRRKHSGRVVI